MNNTIKIKLDPGAEMPHRAHATDTGADIKALHTWLVQGDGTEHPLRTMEDCQAAEAKLLEVAKIKIDTGVHATPPPGFYIELVPNSRLAKSPCMFANSVGIIDPEYTGSMKVILNCINFVTPEDLEKFLPGKTVGQLILRRRHEAEFIQVDALDETERGSGGFGSTEAKQTINQPEKAHLCATCDYFTPYDYKLAKCDGRCILGYGTYGTHTLYAQEACGAYRCKDLDGKETEQ